jgi:S-adenosyl-L-methionine hydrolase (adenosine-forming)
MMVVSLQEIRYHEQEYKQQVEDLSSKMGKLIALLTDFGTEDIYLGVMKAVMKKICPEAEFVDISHAITAQNIREGALALENSFSYFPKGTIFLAVVDPGVGSVRHPIFVETEDYCFVAPDNGLLSYALSRVEYHAQKLENPAYKLSDSSYTFHGRDVFAPAAAYAALGIRDFGDALYEIIQLPQAPIKISQTMIEGEVVHIDHFGNLISSIGRLHWEGEKLHLQAGHEAYRFVAAEVQVSIGETRLNGIKQAYYLAGQGNLLAQIDSNGYLEIAVNQGNAEKALGAKLGEIVRINLGELLAN